MNNYPQFPLYIPSKGRSEYMITSKVLTKMGIKHFIVVEPFEIEKYKQAVKENNLLTTVLELDLEYKKKYELCDDCGFTKSTGSGPARNFAWDHSIKSGFDYYWIMDDNISCFKRLNNNSKIKIWSPSIFRAMEDFVLRYKNVAMAGPNYDEFIPARTKAKPFHLNTRIYSCNLIKNNIPFRWRGRYNEDTILSLDILSAGYCTILFNVFMQDKMPTQKLKGGNTTDTYFAEGVLKPGEKYTDKGTLAKTQMLCKLYPNISKMVYRFSRIHHHVDYSVFKNNKLIRNPDFQPENKINEYGIELKQVDNN